MEPLIMIGGVLLVVGLLALLWARTNGSPKQGSRSSKPRPAMEALDTVASWPPEATRVLTVAERKAYFVVRSAMPDHMVLAQVPLSRFMKVPTRNSYSEWLRRVGLMSVDLLVCDASSQVVAVIDVRGDDGKESSRAKQRHARMDRVIATARIPIIVWAESAIPSISVAREQIHSVCGDTAVSAQESNSEFLSRSHLPQLDESIEVDAALDADHQRQDPPPSTWFDNLDSAAVPLGNVPSTSSGTSAHR